MNKFTELKEVSLGICPLDSELIFINESNHQVGSLLLCYSSDNTANIFSVTVLEKYRGKKYGKKLIEFAIEKAKSKGLDEIGLSTEVENTVANNLYKSFGFKLNGVKDEYNNYSLRLK